MSTLITTLATVHNYVIFPFQHSVKQASNE